MARAGFARAGSAQAGTLAWFARHELRLAWRDWVQLMSGGRRLKDHAVLIGMAAFTFGLHWLAYALLSAFFAQGARLEPGTLALITAGVLLTFTMMLSQAMESVTRAFYSRDDLDLILSSPASSRDLFLVRIAMMALTTAMMSGLMVAPFINVAAALGGAQWLGAYLVVLAVSLLATGGAVLIALSLFRTLGAKRTRLVAQIAAAVVGASFLIGLQVVAIISYGSMSRFDVLNSALIADSAPGTASVLWLPAHAVTGNLAALAALLMLSAAFFVFAAHTGAVQFRRIVIAALGVCEVPRRHSEARRGFRAQSTHGALMQKELKLIARDPWLISQTLMQVLYLIPPALMLWVNFGEDAQLPAIIAPVIVMAVGQLAGGLAWLTISGEDAPDLIATAPVSAFARLSAKVKAVLVIIAGIVTPIVLAMALMSVWGAFVTLCGALIAAACAILIQLWFRAQAKRSNFRRRQVASKASTFCEAFASILCAGTTALVAALNPIAILPGVLAIVVMGVAWAISPKRA
ncbi:MAG: permease [Alphaproteobacteria bacterium]|nr:permease [Alphaproteobacteria bacterium]